MISHLKSQAQAQRTIVCSIHQPSSEIFEMFDDVLILSEGQCIYNGPLSEMTALFHEEGFTCPKHYNRADFAIEVASKEMGKETERLIMRLDIEFAKQNEMYLTQVRVLVHIVIGLLLGMLCYDIGNDASKIISNIASLYFVVFFLFMLSPTIVALTLEVSVFLREHKNNWYSLRSYYFSKFVADLPLQVNK
ncbi:ATP-binding cassette sub-family G member 4 [Blattella germanica]|nr:ATP-binding cassette sub-family G member 4 [Blattella germanica]